MQPDQGAFLLGNVYFPSLLNEHGITKKVIAAIPADKGGYRPDPHSMAATELAWHIAISEIRFLDAVLTGEFSLDAQTRPEHLKPGPDLANWYGDEFGSRVEKLKSLDGANLVKTIEFHAFHLPAVMYLGFSLHHTIHHRGQLSTYLRPMGAKVPAIYGESYDSKPGRKEDAEEKPAATERVTGLGGIFFKSDNPDALYAWYEKHLGIKRERYGVKFSWREVTAEKPGATAWSIFKRESNYFEPTTSPFMINYRVRDLDGLLTALRGEGVWIDEKRSEEFGKFAWIRDCDGNRIELWEPPEGS